MNGSRSVFDSAFNTLRFSDISKVSRQVALQNSLTYYWTGEKCAQGHLSFRYTYSRGCIKCVQRNNRINNAIKRQRNGDPAISGEVRSRIEDRLEDLRLKRLEGEDYR